MDLSKRSNLRSALSSAGLRARKNLGQHFLIDSSILALIVKTAGVAKTDTVLEIGPGPGVLTEELAKSAKQVVAVELDEAFALLLRQNNWDNVEIIESDFLKLDLAELPRKYQVVANLPYNITSAVLRKLLSTKNKPISITILVQKEVAQRITARPGNMSILALSIQYYGAPAIVAEVDKQKFYPAPKVDSALLHIPIFAKPVFAADETKLFRLIRIGFAARRKMLKNNLSVGLKISTDEAETKLMAASIIKTARAQELSLDDWHRLYKELTKDPIL